MHYNHFVNLRTKGEMLGKCFQVVVVHVQPFSIESNQDSETDNLLANNENALLIGLG